MSQRAKRQLSRAEDGPGIYLDWIFSLGIDLKHIQFVLFHLQAPYLCTCRIYPKMM